MGDLAHILASFKIRGTLQLRVSRELVSLTGSGCYQVQSHAKIRSDLDSCAWQGLLVWGTGVEMDQICIIGFIWKRSLATNEGGHGLEVISRPLRSPCRRPGLRTSSALTLNLGSGRTSR